MPRKNAEAPPTDEFLAAMDQHLHRGKTSMMLTLVKKRRQRINNRTTWEVFEALKVLVPEEAAALDAALARLHGRPEQLAFLEGWTRSEIAMSNARPQPRNDEERDIVRVVAEYPDGGRVGHVVNDLCDLWGWDSSKDKVRAKALGKANGAAHRGLVRLSADEQWFSPVMTAAEAATYEKAIG